MIGFARSLAGEGSARDVFCNAVAPYAATRMTGAHLDDSERQELAPERVAPLVTALCRPESGINGQVIVAGGGWARRAQAVESDAMFRVASGDALASLASFDAALMQVDGVCRGFEDALDAYTDFRGAVSRGLRQRLQGE